MPTLPGDAQIAARFSRAWPLALLLPVAGFVLVRGLGAAGLWDPWEPYWADAAREAGRHGWFRAGTAPPLSLWGMLAGSAVVGENEWGLRSGGVLLALLVLLCVAYVVERLHGRRAALLATLVVLSTPLFYFPARQTTPEIYLLSTAGSALLLFGLALFRPDERRLAHCAAGACALALALLSAAPLVALAAVAGPFLIYGLVRIGSERPGGSRPALVTAAVVAGIVVLLAGPWYVTALTGPATALDLLGSVQPPTLTDDQPGASVFYLRTWVFGFFPWTCLLPIALAGIASAWRDGIRARGFEICLLLSGLLTFVTINASPDRLPQALAPAAVPIAVLVGIAIERIFQHATPTAARLSFGIAALLYLPALADLRKTGGLRYLLGSFTIEREVPKDFDAGTAFTVLPVLFALGLLLGVFARSRALAWTLVAVATALAAHNAGTLVPALSDGKSVKAVFDASAASATGIDTLGYLGEERPGVRYYAGSALRVLGGVEQFLEHMDPRRPALAVVDKKSVVPADRSFRERYPGRKLRLIYRGATDLIVLSNQD
jgi:4-amino-4-deoxy-L-arabinose transferase-like glycosyltransferase